LEQEKLAIIVSDYPFGNGEPFLHNELMHTYNFFDKIYIIIPNYSKISKASRLFCAPANVEIVGVDYKLSIKQKIQTFLKKGIYYFVKKVIQTKRKYGDIDTISMIKCIVNYDSTEAIFNKKLIGKLKSLNIDPFSLIYYTYWLDSHTYALAKLKIKNPSIKVYSRTHGWDLYFNRHNPPYLPYRKYIYENIDGTFPVSNNGKKYIHEKIKPVSTSIETQRLGTNNCSFNPHEYNNTLHITSIAFIDPIKNIELLIEVLATTTLKIYWNHIGGGESFYAKNILKTASEKLSKKANIKYSFKGNLSNQEIINYLESSTIDLLINTSHSEGLPVSIMEAFSCGIPAIAPNIGGINEIIDKNCGYLLSSKPTVKEIIKILENFIYLPIDKKNTMKNKALKKWDTLYNAEQNYTNFANRLKGKS
tara:strand:- start:3818 stop:5077 length:1260 start_codon:yes stop_codon:yes gene_type:complete